MKAIRINLIYLAAGYSRRFGGNKLTLDVNGKPLFRYGLECILKLKELLEQGNAKEQRISVYPAVVTAYEEIEAYCAKRRIACVRNQGTDNDGMASSINVGIKLCEESEQSDTLCKERGNLCYDMFFTADSPNLDADELYNFIHAFLAQEHTIGAMEYQGILRNPGVFSACWRKEFKQLCRESGGKIIRDMHRDDVFSYHTASGSMFLDIDTREDYFKLDSNGSGITKDRTEMGDFCNEDV